MTFEGSGVSPVDRFSGALGDFFRDGLSVGSFGLPFLFFLWRFLLGQKSRSRIRKVRDLRGLAAPAVLIASVTDRCNLKCSNCYSRTAKAHHAKKPDFTDSDWRRVFKEAQTLGVSLVLVAGGEPLMRPGLLDLLAGFPGILFPLFTNGLLLDDSKIDRLKRSPNIFPVISVEGEELETDDRRGERVFRGVLSAMDRLKKKKIPFGTSITVTSKNFDTVVSPDFVKSMIGRGCGFFAFVEFTPVKPGTEKLILKKSQKIELGKFIEGYRKLRKALFVNFPGTRRYTAAAWLPAAGLFILIPPADSNLVLSRRFRTPISGRWRLPTRWNRIFCGRSV